MLRDVLPSFGVGLFALVIWRQNASRTNGRAGVFVLEIRKAKGPGTVAMIHAAFPADGRKEVACNAGLCDSGIFNFNWNPDGDGTRAQVQLRIVGSRND